ncbi:dihydrofolate reductase family protein [Actinomadura sp. ATCC 31491]|uniref:Dihydrofolate reductase family protein n=1 Tax=Actinomadura luzonensis TaxID=2805427 RepID=A0ABT0G1Y2_9ACTN|nr:dihydrofolate reductase family protein [Actinomadura luzonensis]MCK2218616.1 dihydrofolate reductase family protein [Actinomadura luzonensis]
MAKLVVCTIMSLDGFYAAADGNPLVLPMDAAFDAYNLERIEAADSLLLGADSYRMFMGFWPAQADNPEASAVHRRFGEIYGRIEVSVISDSLTPEDIAPWADRTTVVARADAQGWVKELKQRDSGDIVTFGSRVTWNALLRAGLVDELHLIVGAKALGEGTPIFTQPVEGLTVADVRRLDGSDNVLLRYTTAG